MKLNSIFVIFISLSPSTFVYGLICPDDDVVVPCTCFDDAIRCSGPQITQQTINQAFQAVRDYNSIPPHEILPLRFFALDETEMEYMDLTPLVNMTTTDFYIHVNPNLTTIVGPGRPNQGSIHVQRLYLNDNYLTDEGLGESLKYFAPSLKELHMHKNSLKGSSGKNVESEFEFFPGLSDFTQLEWLDLGDNQISTISNSKFYNNPNLFGFWLYDHENLTIGENAFAFGDSESSLNLAISLANCSLDDNSINMQENGLLQLNRSIILYLSNNQFEFISADNFEILLNSAQSNKIDFGGNPLICDGKMKWLHDQKDKFQTKVVGANCINDPGFDVFTTSLIN